MERLLVAPSEGQFANRRTLRRSRAAAGMDFARAELLITLLYALVRLEEELLLVYSFSKAAAISTHAPAIQTSVSTRV